MGSIKRDAETSYTNPVYDRSFPDPFVLKFRGEYFAYCTGMFRDGRVFGVLRSTDLINWSEAGGAMDPLTEPHPHYWAPEVTYYNGKFYLYYSVGNETLMEIRVATSDSPEGGFTDSGRRLTNEEFAIDPHLVRHRDRLWLFYATDFLSHTHIGTGTVMDEMVDMFTLKGDPKPVTRAKYDWQVYDPARKEKGGVRWHTVEGPFVLHRKGTFFQMFSGGNWQNETYGVSYAVSRDLDQMDEWTQYCDGDQVEPILRTIPGRIKGPGHNSVVRGPNNRELFCIYHRWTENGRVLSVDRMDFAGGDRLFVIGPTDTPQDAPYSAQRLAGENAEGRISDRPANGSGSMLRSNGSSTVDAKFDLAGKSFYAEIGITPTDLQGTFGIRLFTSPDTEIFALGFEPGSRQVWAEWPGSGGKRPAAIASGVKLDAYLGIHLYVDNLSICAEIEGLNYTISAVVPAVVSTLSVYSQNTSVEIGPVDLTYGFEELFLLDDIVTRGWDHYPNQGVVSFADGILSMQGSPGSNATISRTVPRGDYELCINLRFADGVGTGAVSFGCGNNIFALILKKVGPRIEVNGSEYPLSAEFDPRSFAQFRIIQRGNTTQLSLEGQYICSIEADQGELLRISARDTVIHIDMVRFTVL